MAEAKWPACQEEAKAMSIDKEAKIASLLHNASQILCEEG
jgi:hypothetical protein